MRPQSLLCEFVTNDHLDTGSLPSITTLSTLHICVRVRLCIHALYQEERSVLMVRLFCVLQTKSNQDKNPH